MRLVFADTSYFIGLLSPQDRHHQQALKWKKAHPHVTLLTSEFVLIELLNSTSAHQSSYRRLALDHIDELRTLGLSLIVPLGTPLFNQGMGVLRKYADKSWSLVDCVSMLIMQDFQITDILTSDHHFSQMGMNPLLRDAQ